LLVRVRSALVDTRVKVSTCIVGHSESGHHHVLQSDALFDQIMAANGCDPYVDFVAPTPA
jgi:hypothetical protein